MSGIDLCRIKCPVCRNEIAGDSEWKQVCINCSLKFDFSLTGIYLLRSNDIGDGKLKGVLTAALSCRHFEVVIIKGSRDDNSAAVARFLESKGIDNYRISIINDAPQADVTAYLAYECCPTANAVFGDKDGIFNAMVSKYGLLPCDDPSIYLLKKYVEDITASLDQPIKDPITLTTS